MSEAAMCFARRTSWSDVAERTRAAYEAAIGGA